MDLTPRRSSTTLQDDRLWCPSQHGTDCMRSITLDLGAGHDFNLETVTDGTGRSQIASGTAVTKNTAGNTDLYHATADGEEADGHLFESVFVHEDSEAAGASLYWHGVVVTALVPALAAGSADAVFGAAEQATQHILYV